MRRRFAGTVLRIDRNGGMFPTGSMMSSSVMTAADTSTAGIVSLHEGLQCADETRMKLRTSSTTPERLRFALSAVTSSRQRLAAEDARFCEPARRCGKPHLSPCDRVRNASRSAQLAAVPPLAMRFPATEYVASLAMVRASRRLPPPTPVSSRCPRAKCAWKRHGVTFSAERISRRPVADGRREEAKNEEGKPNRDRDGAPTERAVSIRCSLFVVRFSFLVIPYSFLICPCMSACLTTYCRYRISRSSSPCANVVNPWRVLMVTPPACAKRSIADLGVA